MKLPTEIVIAGIMVPPPAAQYCGRWRISQALNRNSRSLEELLLLCALALVCYPTAAHGTAKIGFNQKLTKSLAATEVDWYRIFVSEGTYARVLVDQTSVDVQINVFGPLGQRLSGTDGFEYGVESASFCAAHSGVFRIEVRTAQVHAPRGSYILQVIKLEGGATEYEQRVSAERFSTNAKHLESIGGPEALERALEKYQRALTAWNSLRDRPAVLGTLVQLGEVSYSMHSSRSLHYLAEAMTLSRELGDVRTEGEAYNDAGMMEWQEDEPEAALADLAEALRLWKSVNYGYGEAAALSNQGILLTQMGEYQGALNDYFEGLELIEPVKDMKGEAFITNNIGAAYRWLGEYGEAADYLGRAIRLFRLNRNRVAAARATLTLSRVDIDLGYFEDATRRAQKALAALRGARDSQWEADAWCVLGEAYQRRGRLDKALECDSRSLAESRAIRYLRGEANSRYNSGVAWYEKGDAARARQSLLAALPIERRLDLQDREAATLYALAEVDSKCGRLTEAALWAKSAIDTTESLRGNVPGDEFRTSFLAGKLEPYSLYIDILMRLHSQRATSGSDKEALETSERARARSLMDMLREGHEEIPGGTGSALLGRERTLRQQLSFESARLLEAADSHDRVLEQRIRDRVNLIVSEYKEIEARIQAETPSYAVLTQPKALTVEQIQHEILSDDDTVLLEYELGEQRSYAWALSRNSLFSWEVPARSIVEQWVTRVDKLIREPYLNANDREHLARAERVLSQMLITPVIGALRHKKVLVVGDGILQSLPFAALPVTPEQRGSASVPFIVEHEIVMLPSASTLAVLRHELDGRQPAPRKLAVLADPVFDRQDERVHASTARSGHDVGPGSGGALRRLLFSREEAEDISALVPPATRMVALDFAASKQTVLSGVLQEYQILHISTHGILNQVQPELSGLVFSRVDSRGDPEDGFVGLYEIYNLKLAADLVVLSACDTFLGANIRGEGLVGLVRGFMYSGAKAVVASLWSVDDQSTAELMKRFYENMLGSKAMRPGAALRAAEVSMWQDAPLRPYNWAGFVIEGEW